MLWLGLADELELPEDMPVALGATFVAMVDRRVAHARAPTSFTARPRPKPGLLPADQSPRCIQPDVISGYLRLGCRS